jgi:hypothetical protein
MTSALRDSVPPSDGNNDHEIRLRRLEYQGERIEANLDLLVHSVSLLVRSMPPPAAQIQPLYQQIIARFEAWELERAQAAQRIYPHEEETQPGVRQRLRALDGGE